MRMSGADQPSIAAEAEWHVPHVPVPTVFYDERMNIG